MSSYHKELLQQLQNPNASDDKKYISKMLINAIEGLYSNGIYIYPNIIELFSMNGFKTSQLYSNAIINISNKLVKELNADLRWISSRTFKKANNREKNIIICYLLFIYHEHFIQYLKEFLLQSGSNEGNVNNLVSKLQGIVKLNPNKNNSDTKILNENKKTLKKQEQEQERPIHIYEIVEMLNNHDNVLVRNPGMNGEEIKKIENCENEKKIKNQLRQIKIIKHKNECSEPVGNMIFKNNVYYGDGCNLGICAI